MVLVISIPITCATHRNLRNLLQYVFMWNYNWQAPYSTLWAMDFLWRYSPTHSYRSVWGWLISLAPLPFYLQWDRLTLLDGWGCVGDRAGWKVLEEEINCLPAGNRTNTLRSSARNPVGIPHALYRLNKGPWSVCDHCAYSLPEKRNLCKTVTGLSHFPQHLSDFCLQIWELNCSLNQLNPVHTPTACFFEVYFNQNVWYIVTRRHVT